MIKMGSFGQNTELLLLFWSFWKNNPYCQGGWLLCGIYHFINIYAVTSSNDIAKSLRKQLMHCVYVNTGLGH